MFTAIGSFCDKTMHHWNVLLSKACISHVQDLLHVTIRGYIPHTLSSLQSNCSPNVAYLLSLLKPVQQQKQSLIFGHKQPFDDTYIYK